MLKKYLTAVFAIILFSFCAVAQKGTIRGTVIDDASGESLIGVTVVLKGTTTGAITDFDGKFNISVAPGAYDLQASFVSFQTVTITGLQVKAGEATIVDQIRLQESVEELEAVTVTAEVIKNSEAALLTVKRKSAGVLDGISAAKFRKIGDSDASEAVKRVTGVSVEGGKYVYVRGLGDRYTKTMLNSVDIPGLDPDRNSLQIDIFPTNLIDNMLVMKSALAEMPADFTGGVVDIETKDFPDDRIFDVSASVGVNPSMHFNRNSLDYQGSQTDWLGFDNGARELPSAAQRENIPSPLSGNSGAEVNDFLNDFNPTLGTQRNTNFMDYSLGVTLANQWELRNDHNLGYIFSGTYKNTTKYYDDVIYGEYQLPRPSDEFELVEANTQRGQVGENNVLLGGLVGLAYKTDYSKYRLTVMHLQNGESKAAQFDIFDNDQAVGKSGYQAFSHNIDYSQRGLTNILVNGQHYSAGKEWKVDWRVSPTFSNIEDPDVRKTTFTEVGNNDYAFSAGAGGLPNRIWRYLDEINMVGKVDVTREYEFRGSEAKFKFGVSHVYKERDYVILTYDLQFFGKQPDYNGDPEIVLNDEYLYPNGTAYYSSGNNVPNPNQYNSNVNNLGVYISNEFSPVSTFKMIVGLRGENYVQRHTGRDAQYASQGVGNNLDNDKVLDSFDLFPSASVIYSISDDQNIRASYSRTIARPSFKELSFAQILDPITNRIFNGGLFAYSGWDGNLTETRIDNYDIRWELFARGGQLFSISGFYKKFDDPIELVRIPEAQTSNEFQPRNVGDGQVYGAEIEFRKNLAFVTSSMKNFSFNGNITLVRSQIEMTDLGYNSRLNYQKAGQTIDRTREMAGQSPYIINGGLTYDNPEMGFDAGFFYNVKGKTLVVVGGSLFPDVYSEPFHSLNFNLNKDLGNEKRTSININVSNILDDVREEFYIGFRAEDQHFTRFSPGRSFSLGVKHSF